MASEPYINLGKGNANIAWAFVDDLMVTFTCQGDITDERFAELVREAAARKLNYAIGTGLGRAGMTSVQRKQSAEVFKGIGRIVTVYDDRMTRGIITALGWLGLNVKSYDWDGLQDAIAYLAIPTVAPKEILRLVHLLRDSTLPPSKKT